MSGGGRAVLFIRFPSLPFFLLPSKIDTATIKLATYPGKVVQTSVQHLAILLRD